MSRTAAAAFASLALALIPGLAAAHGAGPEDGALATFLHGALEVLTQPLALGAVAAFAILRALAADRGLPGLWLIGSSLGAFAPLLLPAPPPFALHGAAIAAALAAMAGIARTPALAPGLTLLGGAALGATAMQGAAPGDIPAMALLGLHLAPALALAAGGELLALAPRVAPKAGRLALRVLAAWCGAWVALLLALAIRG